mmetsp:Transcript_4388/g.10513  ORF Transcript_4388/g.10513 Transcript_4388/m.10513 type:complete len:118 (+) Transcript_4388:107-460(+)
MNTVTGKTIPSSWFLSCILLSFLLAEPQLVTGKASSSFWSPASSFGVLRQSDNNNDLHIMLLTSMRGGSTEEGEMADEDEDEADEIDEVEEKVEEEEEEEEEKGSKTEEGSQRYFYK